MADIRLKTITVEPTEELEIKNGTVIVSDTTISSSFATGAIIINGGIGIKCSTNSTSNSSGGAITVAGGVGVGNSVFIGNDLTLDTSTGRVRVQGSIEDRLLLDSVTNKQLNVSVDGLSRQIELKDTYLKLNISTQSENASTGALDVVGGVAIRSSQNSTSVTSGGALTIAGGVGIARGVFVGGGINSIESNTLGGIITTDGNVGIGTSIPSERLQITGNTLNKVSTDIKITNSIQNQNYQLEMGVNSGSTDSGSSYIYNVSNSAIKLGTNNTERLRISASGLIGINTSSPTTQLDVSGTFRVTSGGANLSFNSNTVGPIITTGGNVLVSGNICTGTLVVPLASSASFGSVHVSNLNIGNTLTVTGPTTATISNLRSNSITTNNLIVTGGSASLNYNSNTIGSIFTTGGNVGINTTNPSLQLDITEQLGVKNSTASWNHFYITANNSASTLRAGGVTGLNIDVGNSTFGSYGDQTYTRVMTFTSIGNVGVGTTSPSTTIDINGTFRVTNGGANLSFNSNTIGSIITTDGNVGIGNVAPNYKLDVNGTLHANGIIIFTNDTSSTNSSTGALVIQNGGVSINETSNSSNVSNGGALTVAGGASFAKNVFIGGTTNSSNASTGTIVLTGGMAISNTTNATNASNGGALTIAGGAGIGGDLYLGGTLYTYTPLTLTELTLSSTEAATDFSSGSLITLGGITVRNTTNSVNTSNGGALLVAGGASIGQDVIIGGNSYNNGYTIYNNGSNNLLRFQDSSNNTRFSIDKDTSSHNFSISRYSASGVLLEQSFSISHTTGQMIFNNTVPSTSTTSGSMLIQGGISINTTSFATDKSNGGGLTVAGGVGISKNLIVGGDVTFVSTTQSYDNTNGALVVIGGVGINGNLNVAGNTILQGNLIVNGTTTSLVSTNTELTDNIFMLNAGPTGTKDSGFVINRWQYNNDDGEGDVVSDALYTQDTLQSPQGSLNANEVRLSTNASSSDDYYNGWWIKMISGANATPNPQVRKIIDYDGTSKIATLSADWTSSNPAGNDTYRLYNKPYIGLVYNEDDDIFEFGATVEDPSQTISSLIFTESMPIRFSYAQSLTSTASTNASSGALLMAGGISINNTTNASSATNGGTFTTLGGGGIAKSLYVGESLYVSSVNMTPNPGDIITSVTSSGVNNQSSFASITGMSFSNTIWGFDVYMTTHIQRTEGNLYTNYHLRGVNKITSWELIKSYVGDDSGLEFDINTSGQIRYTSPDYGLSFTDLTFKWRTFTN